MYTGPKLTNDNLVFGYDTGYGLDQHSSSRHYKGEPATNLIASGIHGHHGSGSEVSYKSNYYGLNSDAGVFQRNFVNNPALANSSTYNNNAGLNHSGLSFSSLAASTEYILVSFDFYMIEPYVRHSSAGTGLNGYMRILYTDGSYGNHSWNTSLAGNAGDDWNNNSAYIGQWRKIGLIADLTNSKTPASINAFYIYNDRTITGNGVFTNFIITEHATIPTSPKLYTSSSRSDTASLIDLKKTVDIDMDTVSFDSTGQPEFDGTDDFLTIAHHASQNFTGDFTIEAVFKPTGNAASCLMSKGSSNDYYQNYWLLCDTRSNLLQVNFIMANSTNNGAVYTTTDDTVITIGAYHHIVATVSGTTSSVYVNGVLEQTGTIPNRIQLTSDIKIGRRIDGFADSLGSQPVAKLYNTALTVAEINSNFNAYKNRFDIQ